MNIVKARNSNDLTGLYIKNGDTVALEFCPTQNDKVIKTHLPEHGDMTYDVEIRYVFNDAAEPECLRLRDMPGRALIFVKSEAVE